MALKINTKINYVNEVVFEVASVEFSGNLFHKRDYYANGSCIDFYGIEINKDHFMDLMNHSRFKDMLREADGG